MPSRTIKLTQIVEYMLNVPIGKGATQPQLYMRGVESSSNASFKQSAGLFIDGFYSGCSQLAAVSATLGLECLEVLKTVKVFYLVKTSKLAPRASRTPIPQMNLKVV